MLTLRTYINVKKFDKKKQVTNVDNNLTGKKKFVEKKLQHVAIKEMYVIHLKLA